MRSEWSSRTATCEVRSKLCAQVTPAAGNCARISTTVAAVIHDVHASTVSMLDVCGMPPSVWLAPWRCNCKDVSFKYQNACNEQLELALTSI